MSTTTSSKLVTKDPNSIEVFRWDWDSQHLAASVEIDTSSWTISGPDAELTKDQESVVSGNRKTQLRLTGGTPGKTYIVTNRIVTDETPAQTKDWSVRFVIQQK